MTTPKAILAYGYDLSVVDQHFEWDYVGDKLTGGPDWYDEDNDSLTSATVALLAANGVSPEQHEAMTWTEQEAAVEAVGAWLVRHSGEDGDEILLLAAKVYQTDWENVLTVPDLSVPDGADERLTWALGVLGITPEAPEPRWLLAAHES